MRGAALVAVLFFISPALGNPPIKEPPQYEQLCNDLNMDSVGAIDMSASMVDRRIALDYFNALSGNGRLEMDSENVFSESAQKIRRDIRMNNSSNRNVFERSKITYSGEHPIVGAKSVSSNSFSGGFGANIKEAFSVKEMEGDLKRYFGSTETATDTHLVGTDTKSKFNGTWTTDTIWHKIFDKNIQSHESFSGNFEVDRQIRLHEKAPSKPVLECTKTPSSVNVSEGNTVTYGYAVHNPSDTVISSLNLMDSDLERIKLDRTAIGPNETARGTAAYTVTEDDILAGPREVVVTATGIDNSMERVQSHCSSWLIPIAEYYEGISLTTIVCPERDNSGGSSICAGCEVAPDSFDLNDGSLTIYALDVDMANSRYPPPTCPYGSWPKPEISTIVQFGVTSGAEASVANPPASAWQSLSLDPGTYQAKQAYRGAEGGIIAGGLVNWSTPYGGLSPNGGIHCTGDSQYDSFDLKMVLTNLGPGAGFSADAYQRVYESTLDDAYEWRQIGLQVVPPAAMDISALRPFMLVANTNGSTGGGTVSWSRIIAAT
jgi:hypothetical protein